MYRAELSRARARHTPIAQRVVVSLLPQQLNNVILNDYLRSCWPICCNLLGAIQTQGSGVVLIKAFSIARPLRRSETDTSIIFQPAKCRVEFECELIFLYKMFDVE